MPRTLTANIRSHSPTVSSWNGFFSMLVKIAALLTSASIRRNRSSASAASASVDASSETSVATAWAGPAAGVDLLGDGAEVEHVGRDDGPAVGRERKRVRPAEALRRAPSRSRPPTSTGLSSKSSCVPSTSKARRRREWGDERYGESA